MIKVICHIIYIEGLGLNSEKYMRSKSSKITLAGSCALVFTGLSLLPESRGLFGSCFCVQVTTHAVSQRKQTLDLSTPSITAAYSKVGLAPLTRSRQRVDKALGMQNPGQHPSVGQSWGPMPERPNQVSFGDRMNEGDKELSDLLDFSAVIVETGRPALLAPRLCGDWDLASAICCRTETERPYAALVIALKRHRQTDLEDERSALPSVATDMIKPQPGGHAVP
ncbi:hypothetical protein RRG08_030507 [Elysia crispata]|uniref:Uncharacterized protein n=1 Tax=Elysia crispata TaxID=231223 RepID=A0AAE1AMZ3_9GAST|nr:hypothetical protein RRG08_030507 [Elysia crispata]